MIYKVIKKVDFKNIVHRSMFYLRDTVKEIIENKELKTAAMLSVYNVPRNTIMYTLSIYDIMSTICSLHKL